MTQFTLHLLRHGAPVRTGRMLGRTDCDVTDAGVDACAARAERLAFETLVSSDLLRARHCAQALGTPILDARWRELDFGDWDGMLPSQVADQPALDRFWKDPDAAPPPGGERWSALVARVGQAIAALPPRTTLVVTHAGAMRAALASLCGLSHAATWSIALPYAALLTLQIWDGPERRAQIAGLHA